MCVICVTRVCACTCHTNVAYPLFRSPPLSGARQTFYELVSVLAATVGQECCKNKHFERSSSGNTARLRKKRGKMSDNAMEAGIWNTHSKELIVPLLCVCTPCPHTWGLMSGLFLGDGWGMQSVASKCLNTRTAGPRSLIHLCSKGSKHSRCRSKLVLILVSATGPLIFFGRRLVEMLERVSFESVFGSIFGRFWSFLTSTDQN